MTPADMAELHAAAFLQERPWSAGEFAALGDSPFVRVFPHQHGFALTRILAGESELLTLAVHPAHQRRGIARMLLADWLAALPGRAETAFLEVAADNAAAIGLYASCGFETIATRRGYYRRVGTADVDALVLHRRLTSGQPGRTDGIRLESG
ncbi:GNAT family N-acetyltransferase [Sulfitobacter aestuarii]|uniref:GNAT family N-acetyltransferase n=1 Tax=Sulfitobacter aestuarii TaxID=2161676 RepID=A0ABW5U4Q9_9RHOB